MSELSHAESIAAGARRAGRGGRHAHGDAFLPRGGGPHRRVPARVLALQLGRQVHADHQRHHAGGAGQHEQRVRAGVRRAARRRRRRGGQPHHAGARGRVRIVSNCFELFRIVSNCFFLPAPRRCARARTRTTWCSPWTSTATACRCVSNLFRMVSNCFELFRIPNLAVLQGGELLQAKVVRRDDAASLAAAESPAGGWGPCLWISRTLFNPC
jgi:hypothetical protein